MKTLDGWPLCLGAEQYLLPTFDQAASRQRNVVTQLITCLMQLRRVATRHEQQATIYRPRVTVTATPLWW
jgi:hypothetical protein